MDFKSEWVRDHLDDDELRALRKQYERCHREVATQFP